MWWACDMLWYADYIRCTGPIGLFYVGNEEPNRVGKWGYYYVGNSEKCIIFVDNECDFFLRRVKKYAYHNDDGLSAPYVGQIYCESKVLQNYSIVHLEQSCEILPWYVIKVY